MEVKQAIKSNSGSGTLTTGTFAEIFRVDTRGCGIQGKTVLIIENETTGTAVRWKLDGYPADTDGTLGGNAVAVKAEATLGEKTTVVSTDADKGYAALVLSMRVYCDTGVVATPADYRIDYTTY